MDVDCHMDSEIIETLNILRPPVNRNHKNTQQDCIGYVISDTEANLVRDFTQFYKVEKKKHSKRKQSERTVESSLSLILQKTCKKHIVENISFVDSGFPLVQINQTDEKDLNIIKKPTVKVTVVPRKDRNSLIKLLKTENQVTRITKTDITSSHVENIIATKNVYLIVAGSKEEKIYKIKTTGGIKTFRDKAKDVKKPNENKHFLNMDKKRKKISNERQKLKGDKFSDEQCYCNFRRDNLVQDACAGSSRVKIIGRIELDEDDKYVMKCAATVNGQPVTTDYLKGEKNTILNRLADEKSTKTTKESQATQVDIGAIPKQHPTFDQNIQCNVYDLFHETKRDDFGHESKVNALKGSSSPLVIISVYPKQELKTYTVNTKMDETFPNRLNKQNHQSDQDNINEAIRLKTIGIKTDLHKSRARSPNTTNVSKYLSEADKTENIKSKNIHNTKIYRESRSVSPANRTLKSKTQESKKPFLTNNNDVNTRNQSPNKLFVNDKKQKRDNNMNVTKQNKRISIVTNGSEVKKQRNAITRSKSKSRDKSVNTVNMQTNNSEAEKYNKKIINIKKENSRRSIAIKNDGVPMDHKTINRKSYPKNDISKVSVNIDSEKEFYDVIFEKGKFSTDLIVRKTTKENGSQKYFEESLEDNFENNLDEDCKSDSLENFFPLEVRGRHRRSVSQAFNNITVGIPLSQHISGLNVRDSLEIGHRREDGKDTKTLASKHIFKYHINEDNKDDFLAPVKHFTGDDCIIGDPVERDKEIRELLGIEKKRTGNQTDKTKVIFQHKEYRNDHIFRNRNTLCETLVTNQMLRKCSCRSCFKNKITNKINSPSNEEENCLTDNEESDLILNDVVVIIRERLQEKYINGGTRTPVMIRQSTQYEAQEKASENCFPGNIVNLHNNIESHNKQKAIQLTRKQYRKVKNSIHKVLGKRQKEKPTRINSIVSIGAIKAKRRSEYLIHWNKDVQTDPSPTEIAKQNLKCKAEKKPKIKGSKYSEGSQEKTIVLFARDKVNRKLKNDEVRKIASSVEIRFTDIEYNMKKVACSFTKVESLNKDCDKHNSIETIFRGPKKSHTPNLGASALSLLTEEVKSVSGFLSPNPELKPKKPFLRRLMSCLVMRSATSEETKLVPRKRRPVPTMNSSVDTYYISTSLGAMEMSSSLYDTSASFYSNHTIEPVNRAKRGFFSSVRGLLSTRKS